jgi:hypothetical protein
MSTAQSSTTSHTFTAQHPFPKDCENHASRQILHIGRDAVLLSTRSLVLQLTGATVECCFGIDGVDDFLSRHTHALLVLCHSLSAADRLQVLSRVHQQQRAFVCVYVAKTYSE